MKKQRLIFENKHYSTNSTFYAKWEEAGFSSADIMKKRSLFYGQIVENYNVKYDISGNNYWRIFYADNNNIYLIADGFMHYNYGPKKNNNTLKRKKQSMYKLTFDNVYSQYTGASSINTTLKNKWLSTYLNKYPNSTRPNIKSVAYMLDTSIWNSHYKNDFAEYAIGGPTLEMYCKSYKDTHEDKYIECASINNLGYYLKWNNSNYGTGIYRITKK